MTQRKQAFWLGERRGYGGDWVTQQWVIATGRRVDLSKVPWLDGPIADVYGVTGDYFEKLATAHNLVIDRNRSAPGLMLSISTLVSDEFDPNSVVPAVARFYEQTSLYQLDVWSEWSGAFRPFGAILRHLYSQRLQQLNVPISALDTCRGMTSEILPFVDPKTQDVVYTGWLRRYIDTGNVLYAGIYSICSSQNGNERFVKVVFPLPHGNAIVIMRPAVHADGSLTLASHGSKFGEPGFYFTVHLSDQVAAVRYVPSLKESIHVYVSRESGEVRADHDLQYFGAQFLKLHYKLTEPTVATPP